jgi:hypothetical protein
MPFGLDFFQTDFDHLDQGCQMDCFQTKNPNFGKILEGLGMENVVIFYDQLEHFTAIWYNLWPFGIVCCHLVIFFILVCLVQEKSGNPDLDSFSSATISG